MKGPDVLSPQPIDARDVPGTCRALGIRPVDLQKFEPPYFAITMAGSGTETYLVANLFGPEAIGELGKGNGNVFRSLFQIVGTTGDDSPSGNVVALGRSQIAKADEGYVLIEFRFDTPQSTRLLGAYRLNPDACATVHRRFKGDSRPLV